MLKSARQSELPWPGTALQTGVSVSQSIRCDPWRIGAVAAILVVTLWRVGWLAASRAELSVDESQYWFWGQELAFGYYSKPPLIGWTIGLTTGLLGSDSPFAIRLATPLFHGATAAVILALGAQMAGRRVGSVAAMIYLTLPASIIGSMTISTDTPMLFFQALSLLLMHNLAKTPSLPKAIGLGLAIGLGAMAKYAMLFALPGMILIAMFVPGWAVRRRDGWVAAITALATLAPNIVWNLQHGFATLRHTADISAWTGALFHPDKMLEFLLSQFAVFGPVIFGVIVLQAGRAVLFRTDLTERAMILGLLPILSIVTAQALMSHALANWAVGVGVAGSILAASVLLRRAPGLLMASMILHGTLSVVLPALPALAYGMHLPNGALLFKRYMGQEQVSLFALDQARAAGLSVVVAGTRPLLADLFYQVRNGGPAVYAVPPAHTAQNHFELTHPVPHSLTGDVLYLAEAGQTIACTGKNTVPVELARMTAGPGSAEGKAFVAYRLPAACWR